MAGSLFLVPGTPASSSRAASAVSDNSSLPASTSSRPIWIYFRPAKGNETVSYTVTRANGRQSNKQLHYCLLCEERKAPTIWKSPFAQNAMRHIESKHLAEWQRWTSSNKAMSTALPLLGQKTLNSFIHLGHPLLAKQAIL